jgi:hypothetical protein
MWLGGKKKNLQRGSLGHPHRVGWQPTVTHQMQPAISQTTGLSLEPPFLCNFWISFPLFLVLWRWAGLSLWTSFRKIMSKKRRLDASKHSRVWMHVCDGRSPCHPPVVSQSRPPGGPGRWSADGMVDGRRPWRASDVWRVHVWRASDVRTTLRMGLGFWESGCTTFPFFEACPYTWEGEIFHSSWSLEILFCSKFIFC